jgi:probable rRNA maturation factor
MVGRANDRRVAGDVAISADIARENAVRLKHTVVDEVKILALHGILHLAGFDHARDHGEMARREMKLRRQLNLQIALIERSEPDVRKAMIRKRLRPPGVKRRTA